MEKMKNKYILTIIFSTNGRILLTSSKNHIDGTKNCFTGLLCFRDSSSLRETVVSYIKDNLNTLLFTQNIQSLCNIQYKNNEYVVMCCSTIHEFKTIFVPGINFHWVKSNELLDKEFNIPEFRAFITMAASRITNKSKGSYFEIKYS